MSDWPITFSLPHGFTVGGLTSWALRLTNHLLATGRRVQWVIHTPYEGYTELGAAHLPGSPRFRPIRAPSMLHQHEWSDWVTAYRETLPTIMLPAVLAESYAVAAALATACPDQLRVLAWNHSDNPYDYAYLARYEPIIHHYVVNTTVCEQRLRKRLPTRRGEITLIPHGVDVPPPQKRDEPADRPIRIAYGGRIEQLVKRVLDLPKLAARLDQLGVSFEMRLVGEGPLVAQLRLDIEKVMLRIRRDGPTAPANSRQGPSSIGLEAPRAHAEMLQLWRWADVAVLMSAHEGLSVAMLEAMAAGCVPVVTAVDSGAPDVIREGENGFTFPVGDVDAAARHIASLAGDSARLQGRSDAARETIARRFAFDQYAARLEAVLSDVAGARNRGWPANRPVLATATGPTEGGEELTVPSDARQRLMRLLDQIAREGAGPLVIYGAGRHTRVLADVWADSPVEIVGVIDDDSALYGRSLWGWPIVSPDDAPCLDAKSVVISSWLHKDEIRRRCANIESAGMRVWRLYDDDDEWSDGRTASARTPAIHV